MEKRIKNYTLVLCGYMLFTFILYFLSPVNYETQKTASMCFFVTSYIVAFYLGSSVGNIRKNKQSLLASEKSEIYTVPTKKKKRLRVSIYFLLGYTCFAFARNATLLGSSGLISMLGEALLNPGNSYMSKMNMESNQLFNYITILGAPIFIYALVGGIVNYKELTRGQKWIYSICLILEISRWLLIGTNKGIFDIVILFLFSLLISRLKQSEKNKVEKKETKKSIRLKKILLLLCLTGALLFFFTSVNSRNEISSISGLYSTGVRFVNTEHILFKLLPTPVAIIIIRFISYLTQGYYGLSLGLTLPWKPTFALGSNLFICSWVNTIFGLDVMPLLYQTRVEQLYGWSATAKWHTMYLWFANDFSFFGVIVVMFLLGFLLSRCLRDIIKRNDPYAMCIAYLITMAILYSSANNQIFGAGNTLFAFIALLLGWKGNLNIRLRVGRH